MMPNFWKNFLNRRKEPELPTDVRLARLEARDHRTSAERLRALAAPGDKADRKVLEGVAGNPSAPPEVLGSLVQHAPEAFCRNPIAPFLVLEDPGFAEKVSTYGAGLLLRSDQAPAGLVAQMARWVEGPSTTYSNLRGRQELVGAARLHVAEAPEIGDGDWAHAIRHYWQEYLLAQQSEEDSHSAWELVELGLLPRSMVMAGDRQDALLPMDFAGLKARLDSEQAGWLEAGFAEPPAEDEEDIYEPEPEVLYRYLGAAFRPDIPVERLKRWVRQNEHVARAVAQNPTAPAELLYEVLFYYSAAVRRSVLRNPAALPQWRDRLRLWVFTRALRQREVGLRWHYGNLPTDAFSLHALLGFLALQHAPDPLRRPFWRRYAESPMWQDRLAAAVSIGPRPNGQPARPRHQLLLRRLAEDGITLVRAAARARLRGEGFSMGSGD